MVRDPHEALDALIGMGVDRVLTSGLEETALEGMDLLKDLVDTEPVTTTVRSERPLWDGTHRLKDGSTLIIRKGIAVPNPDILESRRQLQPPEPEEWEDMRIVGTSPCERLERKVCGPENECLAIEACAAVSQLVDREWEERRASHNTGYMTRTSGQCLQALRDEEFFLKCPTGSR